MKAGDFIAVCDKHNIPIGKDGKCPECGHYPDSISSRVYCSSDAIDWSKKTPTGGSNSYYMVDVTQPTTLPAGYRAECNDIIEALGLNFAEGNILKALWRISAHRRGVQDKTNPRYDAEKIKFFAERVMEQNMEDKE